MLLKGPTTVVADGRAVRDAPRDRPATSAWRRPAPATCCPGSSARCSPRASSPLAGGGGRGVAPRRGRPARPGQRVWWPATCSSLLPALAAWLAWSIARARGRWVEVDLDAIRHNVGVLRQVAAPAAVWAVVKADGYGHGAVPVAGRRSTAGAAGLCVALVEEGVELRRRRHRRRPSSCWPSRRRDLDAAAVADRLAADRVHAGRRSTAAAAAAAARRPATRWPSTSRSTPACTASGAARDDAVGLAQPHRSPSRRSRLDGVLTHLAVADEPDRSRHRRPARRASTRCWPRSHDAGIDPPLVHAANSAGALAHRGAPGTRSCGPASPSTASRPAPAWPTLAGDAAPGAEPAGQGQLREAGGRRRAQCPTGCGTVRRPNRRSRPCRSATPTACPAACRRDRGRGAGRRPAPPDRRRRHDGPADGRLRRRRGAPSGRRGGAHRAQGAEAGHGRRVGRRARHHRLRDRRAASVPGCRAPSHVRARRDRRDADR